MGLAKLASTVAPGKWRGMILCLQQTIAAEPERTEAPDSNQEWAQMFLNRSVLFLVESFMKKETSLEQTRLKERQVKRESDDDWLGIKLLRGKKRKEKKEKRLGQ